MFGGGVRGNSRGSLWGSLGLPGVPGMSLGVHRGSRDSPWELSGRSLGVHGRCGAGPGVAGRTLGFPGARKRSPGSFKRSPEPLMGCLGWRYGPLRNIGKPLIFITFRSPREVHRSSLGGPEGSWGPPGCLAGVWGSTEACGRSVGGLWAVPGGPRGSQGRSREGPEVPGLPWNSLFCPTGARLGCLGGRQERFEEHQKTFKNHWFSLHFQRRGVLDA